MCYITLKEKQDSGSRNEEIGMGGRRERCVKQTLREHCEQPVLSLCIPRHMEGKGCVKQTHGVKRQLK